MQVASVKVEADHESTETATMIITCTRMGCRRPVRKELLDDDSMPMCDEHQGLFVDHQRWAVHSPTRGWLVDVAGVFSWDAETARQWASPEVLGQDLQAAGVSERCSFTVLGNGKPTVVQAGLLFLRMR